MNHGDRKGLPYNRLNEHSDITNPSVQKIAVGAVRELFYPHNRGKNKSQY